jgi:hypothetical protein
MDYQGFFDENTEGVYANCLRLIVLPIFCPLMQHSTQ